MSAGKCRRIFLSLGDELFRKLL